MIEEEIKKKNERIIELELMLEEKEDWFNLKSQMVKKLEGELNHVHARHPERFTFDDKGTSYWNKHLKIWSEKREKKHSVQGTCQFIIEKDLDINSVHKVLISCNLHLKNVFHNILQIMKYMLLSVSTCSEKSLLLD